MGTLIESISKMLLDKSKLYKLYNYMDLEPGHDWMVSWLSPSISNFLCSVIIPDKLCAT